MKKKQYTTPVINKVKLVSKNTVLGFCHSSPNLFPRDTSILCYQQGGCSNPPPNP